MVRIITTIATVTAKILKIIPQDLGRQAACVDFQSLGTNKKHSRSEMGPFSEELSVLQMFSEQLRELHSQPKPCENVFSEPFSEQLPELVGSRRKGFNSRPK